MTAFTSPLPGIVIARPAYPPVLGCGEWICPEPWTSAFVACGYYRGDKKCVHEEPQTERAGLRYLNPRLLDSGYNLRMTHHHFIRMSSLMLLLTAALSSIGLEQATTDFAGDWVLKLGNRIFMVVKLRPNEPTTQEPYNRGLISDALRRDLGVPSQAAQEEQRRQYEAERTQH